VQSSAITAVSPQSAMTQRAFLTPKELRAQDFISLFAQKLI
jgi:hypothetical protein